MTSFPTQLAVKPASAVRKMLRLERCGRYQESLDEVREIWEDFSRFPNVESFPPRIAAEILLRCGSLLGFWGHNKQIADSQQNSKNILTEAHRRFLDFGEVEKIAECENYLALAYWRTGELNEADIWLDTSLSRDLADSNSVRIYSQLIRSLIFLSKQKYSENIQYCKNVEANFRSCGDAFLNGSFCTNLGISYNHLNKQAEALKYFQLAQFFHEKSQHKVYLGTVENNLAELYALENRFVKAHSTIDNATELFKKAKDKTREGFSLDTKAQIFFAERKFAEALQTVEKAALILKKSENAGYLVETLMTKTKILIYLNNFPAAVFTLFDAVKIAQQQCGEAAAYKLVQEFEVILQERDAPSKENPSDHKSNTSKNVELDLPIELAHYKNIQGVWINNSHLEKIGLNKGLLAVVSKQNVEKGDLTAIVEKENDEVICGFYDSEYGIVCLEGIDSEPQLFDQADIEILGKIIGVCDLGENSDGKTPVRPLNL